MLQHHNPRMCGQEVSGQQCTMGPSGSHAAVRMPRANGGASHLAGTGSTPWAPVRDHPWQELGNSRSTQFGCALHAESEKMGSA